MAKYDDDEDDMEAPAGRDGSGWTRGYVRGEVCGDNYGGDRFGESMDWVGDEGECRQPGDHMGLPIARSEINSRFTRASVIRAGHNPGMSGTMHEYKAGNLHSGSKSGPVVKNRSQAIAIGLSQERRGK